MDFNLGANEATRKTVGHGCRISSKNNSGESGTAIDDKKLAGLAERSHSWSWQLDSDVQSASQSFQRRFHERFAAGRMSVDGAGDVLQARTHLDRQGKSRRELGDAGSHRL